MNTRTGVTEKVELWGVGLVLRVMIILYLGRRHGEEGTRESVGLKERRGKAAGWREDRGACTEGVRSKGD